MDVVTQRDESFVYTYNDHGSKCTLECPIGIPMENSTEEFVARLMNMHNIPCYVQPDLEEKLASFVKEATKAYYDRRANDALEKAQKSDADLELLAEQWAKAYKDEVLAYSTAEPVCNEMVFSDVYHTLIHSPALETLFNLEHKYSIDMSSVIENRKRDLSNLQAKQQLEMEEAMTKMAAGGLEDEHINRLAQSHFENSQMATSRWASEVSVLQESQRREYRKWVMTVHEDTTARPHAARAYVQRMRSLSNPGENNNCSEETQSRREESFTVHLGAQLKTTHNIRLISADVLDFCRHKSSQMGGTIVPQPQRLQTAMSLYSNSLCGLVLLVDNRLSSFTGIKREFAEVCEESAEFHFYPLEQQLDRVSASLEEAHRKHQLLRGEGSTETASDSASIHSRSSMGSLEREEPSPRLHTGDFYLTRHSNLAEVHVVFHLVCDNSVQACAASDLSSRHVVILGLRHVLRACFRHDIRTVTLPLLLSHQMSEEMTIPWCLKRAELVFKCVKGFMMELATWSAQESRTIQFLVPKGMSDDTFQQISALLPSIFRMSNPVVLAK